MGESPYEQIGRLERKNTILSLVVLVLVIMLAGLALVGWEWAERERIMAETKRLEAAATLERARRVILSPAIEAAPTAEPLDHESPSEVP